MFLGGFPRSLLGVQLKRSGHFGKRALCRGSVFWITAGHHVPGPPHTCGIFTTGGGEPPCLSMGFKKTDSVSPPSLPSPLQTGKTSALDALDPYQRADEPPGKVRSPRPCSPSSGPVGVRGWDQQQLAALPSSGHRYHNRVKPDPGLGQVEGRGRPSPGPGRVSRGAASLLEVGEGTWAPETEGSPPGLFPYPSAEDGAPGCGFRSGI